MDVQQNSRGMVITGWILSAIPALMLITGGINAFVPGKNVVDGMAQMGYPVSLLKTIGTIEVVCGVLYLIPRTAFYGAILLTAYMGGAVATHLRIGDPKFFIPVIFGVIVWIALTLRDSRLRAFITGK